MAFWAGSSGLSCVARCAATVRRRAASRLSSKRSVTIFTSISDVEVVSRARGGAGSADRPRSNPSRLATELGGARCGAGRACASGVVSGLNFARNAAAFGDGVAVLAGPCPQCLVVCPDLGTVAVAGATVGATPARGGGGSAADREERGECLSELFSVSDREVDLELCPVERERNGFVGLSAREVVDEPDGLDLTHWCSFAVFGMVTLDYRRRCVDRNTRIGTDGGIAGAGVPSSMRMEVHTSNAAEGITTDTGRTVPRVRGR